MKQKKCSLCNKIFSRKWNLERHLQDVHKIFSNTEKEKVNRGIIDYNYLPNNIDRNSNFRNNENNINDMIYNENSPYDNNFSNTFTDTAYYNGELYPSYFNSLSKKEKRLSLDDKIKLQKTLKILENHLEKIGCPTDYVFRLKTWLNYSCRREKSDEPLKKFLVQNNLGDLWDV